MRIEVTQKDIDRGKPCDDSMCPIALAIKRQIRRRVVNVTRSRVNLAHGRIIGLPKEALVFIEWFDDGLPVQPFSFDLPLEP